MPQDSSFPEPTWWNGGPDGMPSQRHGRIRPRADKPDACMRCGRDAEPGVFIVGEGLYCSWTCYRLEGEGGTSPYRQF